MTIEINLRLDTKRGVNNYELFTQRKQIAIDCLGSTVRYRTAGLHSGLDTVKF